MSCFRRCLSARSPGRICVDWMLWHINAIVPRNLLSPGEVVLFSTGFLIFVVLFVSLFLPVYLGRDNQPLGYVGSVIPVIYSIFLGQFMWIRACHRMSSSSAFEHGAFHYEKWAKQADAAWNKIAIAFKEMKMRERTNHGTENTKKVETTKYEDYAKTVLSVMRTEEVVDLPAKLQKAVENVPKTHYEAKLLRIMFPPTEAKRRLRNRRKIIYLPLFRMWVWKRSLQSWILFFAMFVIPLTVFLPISYAYQPATAARRLQVTTNDMYASSYYALYVFSILIPFVYAVLVVLDISWRILHFTARILRERCSNPGSDMPDDAIEQPIENVTPRTPAKTLDPRKRNVEVAKSDLIEAFEFLHSRWQFQWESVSSIEKRQRDAIQTDAERNTMIDALFTSLETFQADNLNPDFHLMEVRVLALAGRALILRRDLLGHVRRYRGITEGVREAFVDKFKRSPEDLNAELSSLETGLNRHLANYPDLGKNFHVQQAMMVVRMLRKQLELLPYYYSSGSDVLLADPTRVQEALIELDSLFFGIDKPDAAMNEIQFQQIIRDVEDRLEGALFEWRTVVEEGDKSREMQFLSWVGIARIRASRNLPDGDSICQRLKAVLLEELNKKNSTARKLAENGYVRKCFFWVSFSRTSREIESIRRREEASAGKQYSLGVVTEASLKKKKKKTKSGTSESQVSLYGQQMDQLFNRLERDVMDLIFPEVDVTKSMNSNDRKITKYLNKGLHLPNLGGGEIGQQDQRLQSTAAGVNESDMGSSLLNSQEVLRIERVLAQAQAGEVLAQLLLVRYQSAKRRADAMNKVNDRVDTIEERYSKLVRDDESIKYVKGLAKLEDQLFKVNHEWEEQLSSKRSGTKYTLSQTIQFRENCFRLGVSFQPEIPRLAKTCGKLLEELACKSYAGLVLMNVLQGKLEEAENWTDKLRVRLPVRGMESPSVSLALAEYRKARMHAQLGTMMYRLYSAFSNRMLVLNFLLFWLLFALPLILGLNFVLNHPEIPNNAREYNFRSDSVFWLQFFGVLLPLLFILGVTFRWTLERRTIWFGEKQAEEEMQMEIINTLIASQIAKKLDARRRQTNPSETHVESIAPKFGGEYPIWSVGEHLVTLPGRKRVFRRGHRIKITRMALVLFFFVLCPIVAFPPTIVILTGDGVLAKDSPYVYIMLVLVIFYPLATLLFFAQKLIMDALPRTVRNAKAYILSYFIVFVAFPLVLGVPLLVHGTDQDRVAKTCLYTWVITSLLGAATAALRDVVKNFGEIRAWSRRLTWEKNPIKKLATFTFRLSLIFVVLVPPVVFIILIVAISYPPSRSISSSSQSALSFVIGALEVTAVLGCVAMCTAGVKLGVVHPRLAASSLVPTLYVCLGAMAAVNVVVHVVRKDGNIYNVEDNAVAMRPLFESSVWAAAFQILITGWGYVLIQRDWTKKEMFGYFPDDWELIAPTARFVVEEARDVPFLSDEQLKKELAEHGLEIPLANKALDRAKAEQALEDQVRKEKESAKEFEFQMRKRKVEAARELKHQLAETVFAEVMHSPGEIGGAKPDQGVVVRQYRVRKLAVPLNSMLQSVEGKRVRFQGLSFRPTHFLDLLETELHVVNILFKVIHAYSFESIQEFRYVTSDTVVKRFPNFRVPEILISVVEIRFSFNVVLEHSRLFVFESPDERDDFMKYVWKHTVTALPLKWSYYGTDLVDSIARIPQVTDSANV